MKSLVNYINESFDDFLKMTTKDRNRLLELDFEYGKIKLISRYECTVREVTNKDEEYEKFKELYIKKGIKYFPKLKYKELKYNEYDIRNRCKSLIDEFYKLNNCFLSKYYIKSLKSIIHQCDYLDSLSSDNYKISYKKRNIDQGLVDRAFDIVKKHPYKSPGSTRTLDAYDAKERIEKELKKIGYDWKIIMKDNMLPRMGVNPEKTFRINKNAKFSEIDLESLVAHEIKAHVAKRHYGYESGLWLFVFGIGSKNTLDEGLAIWNTFNLLEEQKPNALFSIAIKVVMCYYLTYLDFCDAFTEIKKLVKGSDFSDKNIFSSLIRLKRATIRTDRLGYWSGDIDYMKGYEIVDKMTDEDRDVILKHNVGLDELYEIDTIDKFLKVNDIKPISNNKLNKLLEYYNND